MKYTKALEEELELWQMRVVTAKRLAGDVDEANRVLTLSLDDFLGEQLVSARVMKQLAGAIPKWRPGVKKEQVETMATKIEKWFEGIIEAKREATV